MAVEERKVEEFLQGVVGDLGATLSALLLHIGDKLGLYKALAEAGPTTPAELARRTNTDERYVREWLCNQAAGGYVSYDSATGHFYLDDVQEFCLAKEDSPAFVPGGFEGIAAIFADESKCTEAFRTGRGIGWDEHDPRVFSGTERFFRPQYAQNLTTSWIPALDGVEEKLKKGARVADVGCGHGASTVIMARSYPSSTFVGFDFHGASIERARKVAREAGLEDRVSFEVAGAKDYPGSGYDLVAFFDCLHDMGDPLGALRHVRETLSDDGTVLLVEPYAGDRVEENLNPVGRVFYGFSTTVCTPCSRAQEVGLGLGAQAGEARWRELFQEAGFSKFRRATETPFNLILEARV